MQPPWGSPAPGETELVLKRQGGCLPCLGSFPEMTGPGLEAWTVLAPGFSRSKARGQVPAVTGTSVTLSPYSY